MAQQNQQANPLASFLIFGGLFIAVIVLISIFLGDQLKFSRIEVYSYYVTGVKDVLDFIGIKIDLVNEVYTILHTYEPKELTAEEEAKITSLTLWIVTLPLMALTVYMYLSRLKYVSKTYNRIFSRKSLVQDQLGESPWLIPIANVDLDVQIEKGKWAMSKRPLDFCKKYSLLSESKELIADKAAVVFANQVGKVFNGFENMEKHQQALLLAFAENAKGNAGKKECMRLLNILSTTYLNPDYSWVQEKWEKSQKEKVIQTAIHGHSYNYTVILRALEEGRGGEGKGVLPAARWIWLKVVDRSLWFATNNLGRKECFTESAGIINHFKAEKILGKPILRQYVNNAVAGLNQYVSSVKITANNYDMLEVE